MALHDSSMALRVAALASAAFLNAGLAAVLWMRGVRRVPESLVPALALSLSGWSASVCLALTSDGEGAPLFWTRISFLAGSWVLYSIGQLALYVPYPSPFANHRMTLALAAVPVFFSLASFSPSIVRESERLSTHVRSVYGPLQLPFMLYALATALATLGLMAWKYRASSYSQRLRVRFFALGVLAVVVTGTLTNAILPRLGITGLNQVGPLTSVGFAALTAYAIVRHRLLDIEIVLRKGLVYSALVGFTALVTVAGLTLAQNRLAGSLSAPVAAVACAAVIVFALVPLREALDRWAGRLFLGGAADPGAIVPEVAARLSGLKGTSGEMDVVLEQIRSAFGAENIRLYVRQGGTGVHSLYFGNRLPTDGQVDPSDPLCRALFDGNEPVTRDEAAARAHQASSPAFALLRDSLDAREAEVAVPIVRGGEPAGILMLGPKTAGRAFRNRELTAASAVAAELSIALENRALLEEVRRTERLAVLGTVAASVAHEFRNPMSNLYAFLQIVNEESRSPDFWRHAESHRLALLEQTRRMEHQIQNLMNLASPRPPAAQLVALHDTLADILLLQKDAFMKRKITATLEEVERVTVSVDPGYLMQVFVNLVLNAAQAMPSGGSLTVRLSVEKQGAVRMARVDVIDTGVGIPEERRAAIFEPFFTTKPDGTGLGLATAFRIVKEIGGSIDVQSEVGKGSTFTVRIPAV